MACHLLAIGVDLKRDVAASSHSKLKARGSQHLLRYHWRYSGSSDEDEKAQGKTDDN